MFFWFSLFCTIKEQSLSSFCAIRRLSTKSESFSPKTPTQTANQTNWRLAGCCAQRLAFPYGEGAPVRALGRKRFDGSCNLECTENRRYKPKVRAFYQPHRNVETSQNLFSHPNRFRSADLGASFPGGEAKGFSHQTPICRSRSFPGTHRALALHSLYSSSAASLALATGTPWGGKQ